MRVCKRRANKMRVYNRLRLYKVMSEKTNSKDKPIIIMEISLVFVVSVLNVSVEFLSSLQGSSQCSGLFSVGSHILCCPCQQLEVRTLEHCLYVRECGSGLWLWVPFKLF